MSNISSAVSEPCSPILSSIFPIENPGVPRSTNIQLSPLVFSSGEVRANTSTYFARPPPVIKHFVPFNTYSSLLSSYIAVVLALPASEPAFGSVSANAPSSPPEHTSGKYFCFCSSVPNLSSTEAKIV